MGGRGGGINLTIECSKNLPPLPPLFLQTLLKHGLLPSIIHTMLTIMATPPSNGEEHEEEVAESQSPISLAAQVGFIGAV